MNSAQMHYPSAVATLLFAIATLLVLALAFVMGISVLAVYLNEGIVNAQSTTFFFTTSFLGLLVGTATVVSLLKYLKKPWADAPGFLSMRGWQIAAGAAAAGLALLLGGLVQDNEGINWLVLPILTIPAVTLPLLTIIGFSTRGFSPNSNWRIWSILGVSVTATPFVLFMLEIVVLMVILLLLIIYSAANPQVAAQIEQLFSRFTLLDLQSEMGVQQALDLLAPYLVKPGVVVPVIVFVSFIVPFIEELLKPLAVWLLAGRLQSQTQGFALGALCGAGFALWETFNVSGQTTEWGVLLFTRVGTGIMHVTGSAVMGAAIHAAVRERRYLSFLCSFLFSVLLHGLWNAIAVTVSFSSMAETYLEGSGFSSLEGLATGGLVLLVFGMLALLVWFNRRLQPSPLQTEVELPAPDAEAAP